MSQYEDLKVEDLVYLNGRGEITKSCLGPEGEVHTYAGWVYEIHPPTATVFRSGFTGSFPIAPSATDVEPEPAAPEGYDFKIVCRYATPVPVEVRGGRLETINNDLLADYASNRWDSNAARGEILDQEQAYLRKRAANLLREYPVCGQSGEPVEVIADVATDTHKVTAFFSCPHCRERAIDDFNITFT